MKNELEEMFAMGDAELMATAGEAAVLVRRDDGERVELVAVISPADVSYTLQRANGPMLVCDRTAVLSREAAGRAPRMGDVLETASGKYELVKVTGWAHDTSWHVDLALRPEGNKVRKGSR